MIDSLVKTSFIITGALFVGLLIYIILTGFTVLKPAAVSLGIHIGSFIISLCYLIILLYARKADEQ